MYPLYKDEKDFELYRRRSVHIGPHLHKSLELVLVLEGSLELGIGQELYHMEKGDLGLVFPELIHHYQVFDTNPCRSLYLLASPVMAGPYQKTLQQLCPENPVIPAKKVHADVAYALETLTGRRKPSLKTHREADARRRRSHLPHGLLHLGAFHGGGPLPHRDGPRSLHKSLRALKGFLGDLPHEFQPVCK